MAIFGFRCITRPSSRTEARGGGEGRFASDTLFASARYIHTGTGCPGGSVPTTSAMQKANDGIELRVSNIDCVTMLSAAGTTAIVS